LKSRAQEPASRTRSLIAALLGALIIFIFSYIYFENMFGLTKYLPGDRDEVVENYQIWRLLTSMLVHKDYFHLISNLIPFTVFAFLLYGNYGLIGFPILPFFVMCFANFIDLLTYAAPVRSMGVSGVVFFMGSFWLTMFCFTKSHYSTMTRIIICAPFVLFFLSPPATWSHVAYRAHIIGAVFGFTSAVLYFARGKKRTAIKNRRLFLRRRN
jgi:membrane associated rhomboid family serine protease